MLAGHFLHFALLATVSIACIPTNPPCSTRPDRDLDLYINFDISANPGSRPLLYLSEVLSTVEDWYKPSLFEIRASLGYSQGALAKKCYTTSVSSGTIADVQATFDRRPPTESAVTGWQQVMFAAGLWLEAHDWSQSTSNRRLLILHTRQDYSASYISASEVAPLTQTPLESNCPLAGSGGIKIQPPSAQFGKAMRAMKAGLLIWRESAANTWRSDFTPYLETAGLTDWHHQYGGLNADITQNLIESVLILTCPTWLATTTTSAPKYSQSAIQKCVEQLQTCSSTSTMEAALEKCLAGQ